MVTTEDDVGLSSQHSSHVHQRLDEVVVRSDVDTEKQLTQKTPNSIQHQTIYIIYNQGNNPPPDETSMLAI